MCVASFNRGSTVELMVKETYNENVSNKVEITVNTWNIYVNTDNDASRTINPALVSFVDYYLAVMDTKMV